MARVQYNSTSPEVKISDADVFTDSADAAIFF